MPRSPLASLDTKALHRELERRARLEDAEVQRLRAERDRLLARIRELDAELVKRGARQRSAIGRRPENESSLADALAKETMSVTRMSEEVQTAGYRTTAANFRTIVNQTVIKDKRFKRVSRGKYTVK